MKVALLIRTLLSGGAEKQCVILAEVLTPLHDVIVIVQNGEQINPHFRERLEQVDVPVYGLDYARWHNKLMKLNGIVKAEKVDVLFSYLTSDNILAGGVRMLNKRLKVVGGIRNCKMDKGRFMVNKLLSRYLHDKTVFNNYSGYQEFIQRGFRPVKCQVISNSIDDLNDAFIERSSNLRVNILSVCRFIEQKDLPTAFNVIKQLVEKEGIQINYLLVGYGELEEYLRELIIEMRLSDSVEMVIKPDNLQDYYKMADIYLCTSLFEGTSNSIMEALSYNLPVVTTNVGDNNQLVEEGENGMVLEVGDVDGMVNHLKRLCTNGQLRKDYGARSKEILAEKFSRSRFEENYQLLINALNGNER
ncbi:glycosyltransferase family 4 protein [Carboxylicivirga sediminis]|uniref:Glycosyltransferase family 4 protein n=1 Tax=Carboxylicivirga sediminis TaxID=2006564 RepID=A0A941IY35_9BACT|nr:glycosyltransferase family 4 protein [Carboxylicivirga sediminis]MBR8537481.1 glycosyltransferase family 4 protein [Carboxylicivirga sediminis]